MDIRDTTTEEVLATHGFRRTSGRVAVLELLATQRAPVTAEFLERELGALIDRGTLYRALEAFIEEGLVVEYDFGHRHAHYELAHGKPHHHHAVCEACGKIEDIPAHDPPHLTRHALKEARGFTHIDRHSTEFYGRCRSCVQQ